MKSENGQIFTDKICNIIKVCAESGVKSFKLADMVIEFDDKMLTTDNIAYSNPVAISNELEDNVEESDYSEDVDLALVDPQAYENQVMGEDDNG